MATSGIPCERCIPDRNAKCESPASNSKAITCLEVAKRDPKVSEEACLNPHVGESNVPASFLTYKRQVASSQGNPNPFGEVYDQENVERQFATTAGPHHVHSASTHPSSTIQSTVHHKSAKAKKVRRKPKGHPRRPLCAYNIFFAKEKKKILDKEPTSISDSPELDFSVFTSQVQEQETEMEGKHNMKKKKCSVLFQALAKCIGSRWRALPDAQRLIYRDLAEQDMKEYRIKVTEYHQKENQSALSENSDASAQDLPLLSKQQTCVERNENVANTTTTESRTQMVWNGYPYYPHTFVPHHPFGHFHPPCPNSFGYYSHPLHPPNPLHPNYPSRNTDSSVDL